MAAKRRYALTIPRPLYDAVKRKAQKNGSTVSSLIGSVLEKRFGSPSIAKLPIGKPACDGSVKASVFLEPHIYEAAVEESERQYRAKIDAEPSIRGTKASPLARVVAGMLTKMLERK